MQNAMIRLAIVASLTLPGSLAYAAEGAATGNATSTPAGPAGDNQGPTKSGAPGMSRSGGMKMTARRHHHHSHKM